jgi:hypothetical protein
MVWNSARIRQFIDDDGFDADEINQEYPNARRVLAGGIFISHSGKDFQRILSDVIGPIYDRFGDGYFLANAGFGGSEKYRTLVRAALHWCDKFIVAVSRHSMGHAWVHAEVDWAIRNDRAPLLICLLDASEPGQVHEKLVPESGGGSVPLIVIDFRSEMVRAREQLADTLDMLLRRHAYPRFPNGRPGWRDA